MDVFYDLPNSVANSVKYYLDGGIIISVLKETSFFANSSSLPLTSENFVYLTKEHIINLLQSGGYIVAIISALIWIISIFVTIGIIWKYRYQEISKDEDTTTSNTKENGFFNKNSKVFKKLFRFYDYFYESRNKLKTQTCFNKFVLVILLLSTFFTIASGIFGFIATSELHVNLSTEMQVDGMNYTEANISHLFSESNAIIPRAVSATAHIVYYMDNFLNNTYNDLEPVIDELIQATNHMQKKSTISFSEKLENHMGTDVLSSDATLLIDINIAFREKIARLIELKNALDGKVKDLEKSKRLWAKNLGLLIPRGCVDECKKAFDKIFHDIKVESAMEVIPNSFKFIYDQLVKENLEEQKENANQIQEAQRMKSINELNEIIDIPAEVKNSVVKNFASIGVKIEENRKNLLEKMILGISEAQKSLGKYPQIILGFNVIFWILVLISGLFIMFHIYLYYGSTIRVSLNQRKTLKALSCLCFAFVCIMLIYSCLLFLGGSLIYTEGCRYMNPAKSRIQFEDVEKSAFDVELNKLLDYAWPKIEELAKEESKEPLPRVRDIIEGVSFGCKNNVGILAALNAIDTYNYTSVYDPEMTQRILIEGKKILSKTISELKIDDFLNLEQESSLGQVYKTDVDIDYIKETTFFIIIDPARNLTWDELQKSHYNLSKYITSDKTDMDRNFNDLKENVNELHNIVSKINETIDDINKRPRAGPLANRILESIKGFKNLLADRPKLVESLEELYDKTIGQTSGEEALKLVKCFGPKIMSSVGKCESIYSAYNDVNVMICSSLLGPLNCLWFFAGMASLFCTLGNLFIYLFLLDSGQNNDRNRQIDIKIQLVKDDQNQSLIFPIESP